jgi:SAM-dependent methyltransferase
MLARAARRFRRVGSTGARFVRADIRRLPFGAAAFDLVLAPYGILQSLIRDSDLTLTLESVARVLAPGGTFAIDLVPDVPRWREHGRRPTLRGRLGRSAVTLVESVRQDRRRRLTHFEQEFVERRPSGAREARRFTLTFRTLSIRAMSRRLERAGFEVAAVLGDYRGRAWDERADVWVIVANR